jgi:uncharacterized membrane protein
MRHFPKLLATSTIALTLLLGFSEIHLPGLIQGDRAEAKSSSGGRSRGGSFSSPSRSSGSSSRRSSGSGSSGSSQRTYRDNYRPSYGYGYSSGYSRNRYNDNDSDDGWLAMIFVLGVIGVIAYFIWKSQTGKGGGEASNEIVTVTELQVGLFSQERQIQERLSELTLNAEMETAAGRSEMLRETVLAILRSPENWSHVRSTSQVVKSREAAGNLFEQFSLAERSKVDAETLVNVGGKVRQKQIQGEDADPGSYIVVTLLVGTENDKPLFDKIHTAEDLKTALESLGAISTDYLLILELLWNPQSDRESLTEEEMLTHYPDLMPLV